MVPQLGGKLTHQSKLYASDSMNLFDTFAHDAPRIRSVHRVDRALESSPSLPTSITDTMVIFRQKIRNSIELV